MFWTLPRKGRRTRTQIIMKRKIYSTPIIEQTTCVMMKFAVCSGGGPHDAEEQTGDEVTGGMAPQRPMF